MADKGHLAILAAGVDSWNAWRVENLEAMPDLSDADLRGVVLIKADLIEADLGRADLRGTDLRGAALTKADLREAKLSKARFRGANLSDADLRGAILSEASLVGADLSDANLNKADLRGANLGGANLLQADLREADLSEADLTGVHFNEANLSEANLSEANLSMADLSRADFRGVNLGGAIIGWTVFSSVDLSTVHGLDTVNHVGPSTIGIDTIYRSGGNIPEVFLRGCGVPDTFIEYMASLVGKPIEFYSCFISYSTKNQDFAERLHNDLQAKGVRCWFAPEDVQGGKKLHEQLEEAIRLHDKLLLILSPHSMASEWVKTEIYNARQQEIKSGRRKLFPVSLAPFETIRAWQAFDADTGKDMAREVREYFVPDFSNWKDHDAYQKAFDRLVRDLKAETADQAKQD
jgi:uncharacterized protein YjbI with pentapeptide repeats